MALWRGDAVGAERMTAEPDIVMEDEIGGRTTSAVTKRRVQRGAMSVITSQRTISTRVPLVGNGHGFRSSYRLGSEL